MRTLAAVVMLTVLAYAIPARADTIVDTLAAAKAADARQDFVTELMLLRPLAKQGNATAQTSLGLMYGNGRGVPKDITRAYYWSLLARAAGREPSKIRVAFLTSQLTRGQVVAIEQEANKFLKQHPPLTNDESAY